MNDLKGIIEDVEKSSLVSNKVIKKVIEMIGQEKWQDINDEEDDICTTAGELSITLRGIEELEKENAYIEAKLKHAEENCINKTCVVFKDKEDCVAKLLELEKESTELKEEIHTWKEANSTNSYKAFQLQEANNTLSKHIVELQNDKGELTDRCRELEAQIEKLKWHKVEDCLPENRRNVYVVYLNGYGQTEKTIASFRHKYWVFNGLKTECKVISWCELPKWEIKENDRRRT